MASIPICNSLKKCSKEDSNFFFCQVLGITSGRIFGVSFVGVSKIKNVNHKYIQFPRPDLVKSH